MPPGPLQGDQDATAGRAAEPLGVSPPPGTKGEEGYGAEDGLNRPQSPVITWRPSARVKLATDLPLELLNSELLDPIQEGAGRKGPAAPRGRSEISDGSPGALGMGGGKGAVRTEGRQGGPARGATRVRRARRALRAPQRQPQQPRRPPAPPR